MVGLPQPSQHEFWLAVLLAKAPTLTCCYSLVREGEGRLVVTVGWYFGGMLAQLQPPWCRGRWLEASYLGPRPGAEE
ncbi:hypothetical protein E2562_026422 [Oryza meyeriana var. granulata]|uniref:Uncharacterized protein n=1 Tax=Oryza meyeriana var. granulata TaxID=110450 RepID=A0A6G1FCQ8_9ORYZ|nr:hypothetical protein E2562_026422 [Oryza meyeriana var. granulata]